MKKITAFKLSDGRIVEDENRANELQKEIDIKSKLIFLCDEYLFHEDTEAMANELYSHRQEFIAALNGQDYIIN